MKKQLILLSIAILGFTSCKKENTVTPPPTPKASIPFTGIWERSFQAGPGNMQTVTYSVYQDSIRYTLDGVVGQADYLLERDTFILDENRFIGHNNANIYYLILIKNITNDSIQLYKQYVKNITEGLNITIPSDTTTQNHGWNTYNKR